MRGTSWAEVAKARTVQPCIADTPSEADVDKKRLQSFVPVPSLHNVSD